MAWVTMKTYYTIARIENFYPGSVDLIMIAFSPKAIVYPRFMLYEFEPIAIDDRFMVTAEFDQDAVDKGDFSQIYLSNIKRAANIPEEWLK